MTGKPKPDATKRLRWATQRHTGAEGKRKRDTVMRALSMRRAPEKSETGTENDQNSNVPPQTTIMTDGADSMSDDGELTQRKVFVNLPLDKELLEEDGSPLQQFSRNKIRTARYTPLIFIPKNLWLQFHNIANVYFLFVTILAVGTPK